MNAILRSAPGASAVSTVEDFPSAMGGFGSLFSGTTAAPLEEWNVCMDELLRLSTIKDNWDGEGSTGADPLLVDGAITLAQSLGYYKEEGLAL